MKRLVSLMLVLVLVGSAVMPVAAEENNSCPSCSGVVTIPNDVKSSIVRGSIAYLKAVQVFNGKDSLMLREHLSDLNLKPVYSKAIVQVVSHRGVTTEIVKVPLKGKKNGLLVYIKNRYGEATVIGILDGQVVRIYYATGGEIYSTKKFVHTSGWLPDKCSICKAVVSKLCSTAAGGIIACAETCGEICVALIENPIAAGICEITCTIICEYGIDRACDQGANAACKAAHLC
ncbi:hypothetical protein [Archaeoglobus neptunius]|uniref:hypothetical protein n=1 Tax=Archaeoglobus neptunius TaxID=2798580 RepID=UPI0019283CD0|nr:hypothetical protein [Archaeoglobus neptunius]